MAEDGIVNSDINSHSDIDKYNVELTLKKLRIERTTSRTALTKFANFLDKYNESQIFQLESRLERFEPLLDKFTETEQKLMLYDETATSDESFEDRYHVQMERAKKILHDSHSNKMQQSNQSNINNNPSSASNNTVSISSNVRFPTLELPKFYGDYEKFGHFRDMFTSLVHNDRTLDNIKKFYYLISCVKGDAAKVIDSIEVTDEKYNIAWALLKERYEDNSITINKHIKAIMELPNVSKEYSLRQLTDDIQKHIRSLRVIGEPVDSWSSLLIYIIMQRLDRNLELEWGEHLFERKNKSPSFQDMIEFLIQKCKVLEVTVHRNESNMNKLSWNTGNKSTFKKKSEVSNIAANHSNSFMSCYFCKQQHPIYACDRLKALPIASRINEINKLKLCLNCLRNNHTTNDCNSRGCKKCQKKHNTILHVDSTDRSSSDIQNVLINSSSNVVATHCTHRTQQIILSTAAVLIESKSGEWICLRALIDNGSMPNFITKTAIRKLGLETCKTPVPIVGIGKTTTVINDNICIKIKSRTTNFSSQLTFLVLDKITENLPLESFNINDFGIPNHIVLADPNFNLTGEIDILLGVSVFMDIIESEKIILGDDLPILHATSLGWIIGGSISKYSLSNHQTCHLAIHSNNDSIEQKIERFWKVEEIETRKHTIEEQECEQLFLGTTKRDKSGHFMVQLPIRSEAAPLGQSLPAAEKRLLAIERKFKQNPEFKRKYLDFMFDYETLNHMSKINEDEIHINKPHFYLPHHGVIKESSTTTKLRVVFDGSCKTSTGTSLNDILKVGPTIQDDLLAILLRFRIHNYVITADIEKMYRQVWVNESSRDLQRIIWRTDPEHPIQHYRLNTVTYGTAPAAFLSIRSLQQVANEQCTDFPDAANAILNDFNVDDLLTGSNTIDSTKKLKNDLDMILNQYGFNLRKWASNEISIIGNILDVSESYYITDDDAINILGLKWYAKQDILKYKTDIEFNTNKITKRTILSSIARIFDPLGFLSPVIIIAKIIMQRLWECKLDWDQKPPDDIVLAWINYIKNLPKINEIDIPRHVLSISLKVIELNGFCDASQRAYGACIYLKTVSTNGTIIRLLCSKTRVAPLKCLTLPRLELMGAVLLACLYSKVFDSIKININQSFFWTDSTIVLSWIRPCPNSWKVFVANRVSEIQKRIEIKDWRHVSTRDNPADILTRGMGPIELNNNLLWWQGPKWLQLSSIHYPNLDNIELDLPEKRTIKISSVSVIPNFELFGRFSSLYRIIRVVALCLRFRTKLRGAIDVNEMESALNVLLKIAQYQSFEREINDLKNSDINFPKVSKKSKLCSLSPFLDVSGFLRVGGRITRAKLPYKTKHQIILDSKHSLTTLIIRSEHNRQLHAGVQTLLASIRERYWILNGRSTIRSVLNKCITCFRINPIKIINKMADLPKDRVVPNRPFYVSGVDFAGPYHIKDGKLRNRAIIKAYLCIFICFSTKGVHLKAVSDLSTVSFLNAFKRFVSRRGFA